MLDEIKEYEQYTFCLDGYNPNSKNKIYPRLNHRNICNSLSGIERAMTIIARYVLFSTDWKQLQKAINRSAKKAKKEPEIIAFSDKIWFTKEVLAKWCSHDELYSAEFEKKETGQSDVPNESENVSTTTEKSDKQSRTKFKSKSNFMQEELGKFSHLDKWLSRYIKTVLITQKIHSLKVATKSYNDEKKNTEDQAVPAILERKTEVFNSENKIKENQITLPSFIEKAEKWYKDSSEEKTYPSQRMGTIDAALKICDDERIAAHIKAIKRLEGALVGLSKKKSEFSKNMFVPYIHDKEINGWINDFKKITYDSIIANAIDQGPLSVKYLVCDKHPFTFIKKDHGNILEDQQDKFLKIIRMYLLNLKEGNEYAVINKSDIANWCKGNPKMEDKELDSFFYEGSHIFEPFTLGNNIVKIKVHSELMKKLKFRIVSEKEKDKLIQRSNSIFVYTDNGAGKEFSLYAQKNVK